MNKTMIFLAGALVVASLYFATTEFRTQTAQGCYVAGAADFDPDAAGKIEHVNWMWQWTARQGGNVIQCVGPKSYVVYRPFDVAVACLVLGAALLVPKVRSLTSPGATTR